MLGPSLRMKKKKGVPHPPLWESTQTSVLADLFYFPVFHGTFILFRLTHVPTTEISSRISSLLENILNFRIKDYAMLNDSFLLLVCKMDRRV